MGIGSTWPRSRATPVLVALGAVLAGGAVGLLVWLGSTDTHVALVVVMAVVAPIPFVVRGAQGRFDPFEPINLIAVAVMVMFVWRPIAELQNEINPFPGYDARPGFDRAMIIAILGTVCIYIGYFAGAGRRIAARLAPLPDDWDAARSVRFAAVLLFIGALLTVALIGVVGVDALVSRYAGRSAGQTNLNAASSGYLLHAPYLVIPASLILLVAYQRRPDGITGALLGVCFGVLLLLTVPSGGRHFILQFTLPGVVLLYLWRQRRPRIVSVVTMFVVFLIAANLLAFFRNTDDRAGNGVVAAASEAFTSPGEELNKFIVGPDPSEFTVLEIEAIAYEEGRLAYQPGSTVTSLVTGWVPRPFFPGEKPLTPGQYAAWTLFPQTYGGASFNPSMFGAMFVDFGWMSVALLSILVGIALRTLWQYFLRAPASRGMQLVYAPVMAMVVIMARNDIADVLYRSVFMILPLVLCVRMCSSRPIPVRARIRRLVDPHRRPGVTP